MVMNEPVIAATAVLGPTDMRIMVTGGHGFIGRHVAREAQRRGHSVRILVRSSKGLAQLPFNGTGLEVVCHDLRERDGLAAALDSMDAVVHCAGSMTGNLETQMADTVQATLHLLSAMDEAGVRQIVGLSTFALYDYLRVPAGTLVNEDTPLEGHFAERAPYVQAKQQQEDLIRRRACDSGWRWTILRPGIVFGRNRVWFHHLGARLGARQWICFAGDSELPLTYVENCAEAIALSLEVPEADGAVLNIVDDALPNRRRYMEELARRLEPRPSILVVPWTVLAVTSAAASWINQTLLLGWPTLPDLIRPGSVHSRSKPLRYSNERAKRVLGWRPRWSFVEALDRSLK